MYAKPIVLISALLALATPGGASRAAGPTDPARRERAARPAGAGHVEDDYAGALAQARRRGVPIIVDVWAPW